MRKFTLLDQYEVCLAVSRSDCFVGYIMHFRKDNGTKWYIRVGHFLGYIEPVEPEKSEHWNVELMMSSDVRYDQSNGLTVSVLEPEEQAGQDKEALAYLHSLIEQDYPHYHPELPKSLCDLIAQETECSEPMQMSIHQGRNVDDIQRGRIWDWEEEGE